MDMDAISAIAAAATVTEYQLAGHEKDWHNTADVERIEFLEKETTRLQMLVLNSVENKRLYAECERLTIECKRLKNDLEFAKRYPQPVWTEEPKSINKPPPIRIKLDLDLAAHVDNFFEKIRTFISRFSFKL